VLADGFYEWKKREGGRKQPVLIRRRDRQPFAFAGLWESWQGPDGPLETCTIVTTEANELAAQIHNRMPVILDAADHDIWLDARRTGGEELLRPCPADWLEALSVSTRVNSPSTGAAALLELEGAPLAVQETLI
jgi:putative SOS response-associated peptidase YedK